MCQGKILTFVLIFIRCRVFVFVLFIEYSLQAYWVRGVGITVLQRKKLRFKGSQGQFKASHCLQSQDNLSSSAKCSLLLYDAEINNKTRETEP